MASWTLPFDLSGFGAAGQPWLKSTSKNLPFQEVLLNAFDNRQSIFSPSPTASGSPDARAATPFYKDLTGGGLAWSYDPNWWTGLQQNAIGGGNGMYNVIAEAFKPRKKTELWYDVDGNGVIKPYTGTLPAFEGQGAEPPYPAPEGMRWMHGLGGWYLVPGHNVPQNDPNDPSRPGRE